MADVREQIGFDVSTSSRLRKTLKQYRYVVNKRCSSKLNIEEKTEDIRSCNYGLPTPRKSLMTPKFPCCPNNVNYSYEG
jgi:hypothetical protein